MSLAEKAALDDLAQHLYDFLPGNPHPYADARISFPGVAQELGLGDCWPSGSKQPALRHLLGATLDGKRGFPSLIVKIVERGITYRKKKNPVTREEIEGLNVILVRVLAINIPGALTKRPSSIGVRFPQRRAAGGRGARPR